MAATRELAWITATFSFTSTNSGMLLSQSWDPFLAHGLFSPRASLTPQCPTPLTLDVCCAASWPPSRRSARLAKKTISKPEISKMIPQPTLRRLKRHFCAVELSVWRVRTPQERKQRTVRMSGLNRLRECIVIARQIVRSKHGGVLPKRAKTRKKDSGSLNVIHPVILWINPI